MDAGYPKEIAQDFPGISGKVDAVFKHEGYSVSSFCYPKNQQQNISFVILIRKFKYVIWAWKLLTFQESSCEKT